MHNGVKVSGSIRVLDAPDGCCLDEGVHGEEGLPGDSVYQRYPEEFFGCVAETAQVCRGQYNKTFILEALGGNLT